MTLPSRYRCDRGGHALFQGLTGCAPLLSHATARNRQAGTSLISQTASSRQADREPAHRTLWTLRPQPQLLHRSSNKADLRAFSSRLSVTDGEMAVEVISRCTRQSGVTGRPPYTHCERAHAGASDAAVRGLAGYGVARACWSLLGRSRGHMPVSQGVS